jgi:hypothetical protein
MSFSFIHPFISRKVLQINFLRTNIFFLSFLFIYSPNSYGQSLTAEQIYKKVSGAVVVVHAYNDNDELAAQGSGVVLNDKGYVVTNYHVLSGNSKLKILHGKEIVPYVDIIGIDVEKDILILKIEAKKFPAIKIGDSKSLNIGQKIYAPKSLEVNGNGKNIEQYPQEEYYQPEESQPYSETEPQSQQYQQDYYQPQEYASSGRTADTETIMDISEQVVIEKTADMIKQLNDLNEFKTLNQSKIQDIEIRLRRIESIIDKLQILILEKVGSYGENLDSIKKEMSMMQDSFGKMINPVLDNYSRKKNYETETLEDISAPEEVAQKRKIIKRK